MLAMASEVLQRIRFWRAADRIGPDIPWTHWRLHFKSTMRRLCVEKFAKFGAGSEFRAGSYADCCSKIEIGRNVTIRPGSYIYADPTPGGGGIIIEDDVLLAAGVHIYTDNHVFSDPSRPISEQGIKIAGNTYLRRGCWIGAGAILLPGIEIGENAVVGAGAVVVRSVAKGTVVVGSPAKPKVPRPVRGE